MGKKYRKITLGILALLVCFGVVAVTYAYFTAKDEISNQFVAGNVDIDIDEEFTPDNFGGTKKVEIKNNSTVPALIRVAIIPRWIDKKNEQWIGDVSNVQLTYNKDNIINSPNNSPEKRWVDGGDGYFYYNTIVPQNENTSELLSTVSANIEDDLKDMYEGKTLVVDVKAEAVQATKAAYEATWSSVPEKVKGMLNKLCVAN